MRIVLVTIGLVGAVLAGCGDTQADCASIADDAIELLQDFINQIDQLPPEEAATAVRSPEFSADLQERATALDQQADAGGCSEAEMQQLLDERTGSLAAESELGRVFLDLILDGTLFGA